MRFGLLTNLGGLSWPELVHLWSHAEATGWDAAVVTDHLMPPTPVATKAGHVLDAWTSLAGLATLTTRMAIGTLVSANTFRHPAVLAKMAANVDLISQGRLLCGIGAGWQANEHVALGLGFPALSERLSRLEEACQILLALWKGEPVTFEGRHYRLADARLLPPCQQVPHPTLIVGGTGERRTALIAARYADQWNFWGGPQAVRRKRAVLAQHCAAVGRDPSSITVSVNMVVATTDNPRAVDGWTSLLRHAHRCTEAEARDMLLAGGPALKQDTLAELADAGVDYLFVPPPPMLSPPDALDQFITEAAAPFRGAPAAIRAPEQGGRPATRSPA